jgi:hypothetical protein
MAINVIIEVKSMTLQLMKVRPVVKGEEQKYRKLMDQHHYLGFVPKIGETLWYVATINEEWVSLLSFSVSALKCKARDLWIGWNYRHQYDRLKLVVNNNRFLILPRWSIRNLGSRAISLCLKRLVDDWKLFFGHKIVLVETFVDPVRYLGTVYKASNWQYLGDTKGFRRRKKGYTREIGNSKMVFVKSLQRNARRILSQPLLSNSYKTEGGRMKIKAEHMHSLPDFFKTIPDPRRDQGKRHRLPTVLGIATAAVLCGMRGYKAIWDWADSLSQQARARFNCRYEKGKYIIPSEFIIRDILVRVDPVSLDKALQCWNEVYGQEDESLAIDGKVMRNAIDEEGKQAHIMSVVGHQSKTCYTQKK